MPGAPLSELLGECTVVPGLRSVGISRAEW